MVKCEMCDNEAKSCDDVPLQIGKDKFFCSQEHMRDYIDVEIDRLNKMGWM